jgi:ADP-heptose:LPS heptosyltransferase
VDLNNKNIIISRTDSIGDVILTLPLCAWLKKYCPGVHITFLGKGYTKPIIAAYQSVDDVLDWNDFSSLSKKDKLDAFKALNADAIVHVFPNKEIAGLAKKARIPMRIGTSHRIHHFWTCNHRLNFTRRKSNLHEAQLNHELLRPFGLNELPSLDALKRTTEKFQVKEVDLPLAFKDLTNFTILHPKSQGSAKEWPIEKYIELANQLASIGKTVVFTGTETEGSQFRNAIPNSKSVLDSTGKLSLEQLMVLIKNASNIVACSTGPLHIAAVLGINTVGLYAPKRPIHPGRWSALGKSVNTIVFNENCVRCANSKDCSCIAEIKVERVLKSLI